MRLTTMPFEGQSSYSADFVPKQAPAPVVTTHSLGFKVLPSSPVLISNPSSPFPL